MSTLALTLLSVNVGRPRIIGERDGAPIISAFVKTPVTAPVIRVGHMALDGDEQADRDNHGGPDCAVYAYPADHWEWWEKEHRFPCAPGTFGENLTLGGADEATIAIGDRFRWGEAVLEVSQPRTPCYKFQHVSGRADGPALMTLSGRCGWHFRVVAPGEAPVKGGQLVRVQTSGGPRVRDVFLAASDRRTEPEARLWLAAAAPALSLEWRRKLRRERA
jgi:MOSC domain-containing protein YiiM